MANIARAIKRDILEDQERKLIAPAAYKGKTPRPMVDNLIREAETSHKWLRFNYKIEDSESGLFGRVLSYLFVERRAFYAEPWPENEWAVYLKAEGDNLKRMGEIGREAGLRPTAFMEVQLEL